ncbi:MAG: hypothetical protein Q8P38_11755 [Candidatus Nanopelagicales bacterium]|nr:hypothetical protein [Candidatus Nanopelagicales bacterium]
MSYLRWPSWLVVAAGVVLYAVAAWLWLSDRGGDLVISLLATPGVVMFGGLYEGILISGPYVAWWSPGSIPRLVRRERISGVELNQRNGQYMAVVRLGPERTMPVRCCRGKTHQVGADRARILSEKLGVSFRSRSGGGLDTGRQ